MATSSVSLYPGPRFVAAASRVNECTWYVKQEDNSEHGPFDRQELDQIAQQGKLGANALVWCEGWPESKLAGELFGFLAPVHYVEVAAAPAAEVEAIPQVPPYQARDPQRLGRVWKTALLIMIPIAALLLVAIEFTLGTFGFRCLFAMMCIGGGFIPLAIALLEPTSFMNSSLISSIRSSASDGAVYVTLLTMGSIGVGLGLLIMFAKSVATLLL